jgi:hypothetical protein
MASDGSRYTNFKRTVNTRLFARERKQLIWFVLNVLESTVHTANRKQARHLRYHSLILDRGKNFTSPKCSWCSDYNWLDNYSSPSIGYRFFCLNRLWGPTQPPIQWVPGALTLVVKRFKCEVDCSPPSSVEGTNDYSYTGTSLISHLGKFYL